MTTDKDRAAESPVRTVRLSVSSVDPHSHIALTIPDFPLSFSVPSSLNDDEALKSATESLISMLGLEDASGVRIKQLPVPCTSHTG